MKTCKDCRWSSDIGGSVRHPAVLWVCSNEQVGSKIDVVDGERIYVDCHVARKKGQDQQCGPDGRLWEAKP